jgi:hypothetical protein
MAANELFIAHSASAEASCFITLGWPVPTRVIDTMVEMARAWNGIRTKQSGEKGSILTPSLLSSLAYFGVPVRSVGEKKAMIERILEMVRRKEQPTPEMIEKTLAYCMDDADDCAKLLAELMLDSARLDPGLTDPLRFWQALWRGRSVAVLTVVEATGTPLDMPLVKRFLEHEDAILNGLIDRLGATYPGVFRADRSLNMKGLERYLVERRIAWPRTPKTGQLSLEAEVIEEQAQLHPKLANLAELIKLRNRMRLGVSDLAIGTDGRNRTDLRPYATKTSRCAPSGSAYLYTQSKWLRLLVQPPKGRALLILDWKAQEVGVAAVLSGCEALWKAAADKDPYVTFGLQAGQSEEQAKENRPMLKITMLGIQFGMTTHGIAVRNKISLGKAAWLHHEHQRIYPEFWAYSAAVAKHACEALETRWGWRLWWAPQSRVKVKSTTARNWPIQSTAAEMGRLAIALAVEAGESVCATMHDSLVVEVAEEDIERGFERIMRFMDQASEMVLGEGRRIRIAPSVVSHPDHKVSKHVIARLEKAGVTVYCARYADKDGAEMFETAMKLLEEVEEKAKEKAFCLKCG